MFVCSPASKTVCDGGTSPTGPTALHGGGRGDLRSPGHLGILAIILIADKIVLQNHAQPLASPGGCFVLGKGVFGRGGSPKRDPPQGTVARFLREALGRVQLSLSPRPLAPGEPAPHRSAASAPAPCEHGACEISHAVLAPDPPAKSRCLKAG